MTYCKYRQTILLVFLISICLNPFLFAQDQKDTIISEKINANIDIAYGKQPAWMVTGSVSSVSGSELRNSFTSNFINRLSGRLLGLTVSPSNVEPGNVSSSIYSRGINTFGVGQTDMLILVDGVESNFSDLIPEEIESVNLLKDASATAMYGSRGANGVLLITTKRGQAGKLQVTFSTQQGIQTAFRLPEFLDSYDYARLYNEALINDGKSELYTDQDLSAYQGGTDPYFHPNVNWYDELLRKNAPISNYNLTFSGGSNTVRYFVSLNHIQEDKLYLKTGDISEFSINGTYQRINFRSNVDITCSKNISAFISLGGTVVDQANPGGNNTSDIFNTMSLIPPNAFPVYNPNRTFSRTQMYTNPLGDILNNGFYTSNGRTLQATAGGKYKLDMITPGLSISAQISFNNWFLSQSNKSRTYKSYAISKGTAGDTVYTAFGIDTPLEGSEGESEFSWNRVIQGYLNYDRTFGVHTLSGVLMYNEDEYMYYSVSDPFRHNNLSGRATYIYDNKYIGEVSFSYMGSEIFPKGHRMGLFPAASFGWVVSREDFLKGNEVINYLKVKGSYGLVGNDKINVGDDNRFLFDEVYTGASNYYFSSSNTPFYSIVQGASPNMDVTWEKEKSYNLGVEASFLNHFDLSLDIFNRDRYDILVYPYATDPDFMGYNKPYLNQGKANNKGFEINLRYNTDKSNDFQFYAEASIWYFKNKIVFNSEALQLYDYLYRTDRPINQPYGLVASGFFKDQADIDASPTQIWTSVKPGDVKYKDQNDDGVIDELDSYPIGKTGLPNLTAGLNIGGSYKGFDFNLFFQGVASRTVSFTQAQFQAFQNNGKVGKIALGRWTDETAETATYPRLSSEDDLNNYRYSTLWQRNGSFVKLRSIEIGYTLPDRLTKKVLLENTRFFINGTNLFSLDHMDGYSDPEILSGYPQTRCFSLGVRVQFKNN